MNNFPQRTLSDLLLAKSLNYLLLAMFIRAHLDLKS